MSVDFKSIVKNFIFDGEFIEANPYGTGHINDTYAANFRKTDGEIHRYILQRINHKVFKEPEKLMQNIEGVTEYLRKKIIDKGGNPQRETLNIIRTVDGKGFHKTDEGEYWRSYVFIEGARTYDIVNNSTHFYNGGKAFGQFQKLLGDFPAEQLHETILDFHNTPKRYKAFIEAVEKDCMSRAKDVEAEIEFVKNRAQDTCILTNLLKEGKIPLRVTHNDTKFNNVMIDDETGEGICVIDLDTVMPGLSLYDFGDSIRTGTNTAAEDEKDLSKVWMDINLFEHFTRGFLDSVNDVLTPTEREYLAFSAKIMTLECGIRFLTDYLSGDTYFKVHREGHNLDRARTQFKLVQDMEAKLGDMNTIVEEISMNSSPL